MAGTFKDRRVGGSTFQEETRSIGLGGKSDLCSKEEKGSICLQGRVGLRFKRQKDHCFRSKDGSTFKRKRDRFV